MYLKGEVGVEPHARPAVYLSGCDDIGSSGVTHAMATGRFVAAPNTKDAIPARAAVAVMRSLRTSEAISMGNVPGIPKGLLGYTFFACHVLGKRVALQSVFETALARPARLGEEGSLSESASWVKYLGRRQRGIH